MRRTAASKRHPCILREVTLALAGYAGAPWRMPYRRRSGLPSGRDKGFILEENPQEHTQSQHAWTGEGLSCPVGQIEAARAYAQQLVTTRLLDCLHDPVARLSRLQRIHPCAR